MRNPRELKVRFYAASLIGINEYFYALPGAKASYKICETKLNENLLNSMSNIWTMEPYVQGLIVYP